MRALDLLEAANAITKIFFIKVNLLCFYKHLILINPIFLKNSFEFDTLYLIKHPSWTFSLN